MSENTGEILGYNPLLKFEISKPELIEKALQLEDLTAQDSTHSVNLIRLSIQKQLEDRNFPNITVVRDNPVVSVADNFDKLLFPKGNVGRSSVYTRYVDNDNVLRTHTSASIPSLLEHIAVRDDAPDDITFILPGLVYRRDVSDKTHLGEFHQMDIWRLVRHGNNKPMDESDLAGLVDAVFKGAVPDREAIVYDAVHPYTVNGIEVYSQFGDEQLEVLEAGLINPQVLRNCGLDPNEYSGLALGMGLDRLVMARKNLSDIRLLRATNPKVAEQMHDMLPYKEISNQPPTTRDLSYVVDINSEPEDISEGIREAFGDNSYLIEEVGILETTSFEDMHPNAIQRLGMAPNQKNVLVRIALRHPDRTLSKKEVSVMYSEAYPKIHQGVETGYL